MGHKLNGQFFLNFIRTSNNFVSMAKMAKKPERNLAAAAYSERRKYVPFFQSRVDVKKIFF